MLPRPAALDSPWKKAVPPYTAKSSGNTFLLNLTLVDQANAEIQCQKYGGHLAAYVSAAEQAEVEKFYMDKVRRGQHRQAGWLAAVRCCDVRDCEISGALDVSCNPPLCLLQNILLPNFHKSYWIGTQANEPKQFNDWIDPTVLPPLSRGYKHWGLDSGVLEPNNKQGLELCAVANASQAYSNGWGWSDTLCDKKFPMMCRMIRERPHRLLIGCISPASQHYVPSHALATCWHVLAPASADYWHRQVQTTATLNHCPTGPLHSQGWT